MNKTIALLGAGGHARVVADCAELLYYVVAVHDDNPFMHGKCLWQEYYKISPPSKLQRGSAIHISVGDNAARSELFAKYRESFTFPTLIHPSSVVSKHANISAGCFVAAGCVVESCANIGYCCILNTGSSINHDCVIDSFVHIAPGATLCGGVTVGARTLIGANATVLPRVKIGQDCIVGAGAVVLNDLQDNQIAIGNPARLMRA